MTCDDVPTTTAMKQWDLEEGGHETPEVLLNIHRLWIAPAVMTNEMLQYVVDSVTKVVTGAWSWVQEKPSIETGFDDGVGFGITIQTDDPSTTNIAKSTCNWLGKAFCNVFGAIPGEPINHFFPNPDQMQCRHEHPAVYILPLHKITKKDKNAT